jgi:transposase
MKARAWDLWLDCMSEREIEKEIGIAQKTVNDWLSEKRKDPVFAQPPASRQHFDGGRR